MKRLHLLDVVLGVLIVASCFWVAHKIGDWHTEAQEDAALQRRLFGPTPIPRIGVPRGWTPDNDYALPAGTIEAVIAAKKMAIAPSQE